MSGSQLNIRSGDAVLMVQLRAMGDTLLSTPLFRSFKQSFPASSIDVLVEPLPAQVLKNNPYIRNIHIAPVSRSSFRSYIPILRRLRKERYSLAIDLLSTPGSALLTRMTGAKYRIGYRLRGRSWAYTHPAERSIKPVYNPLTKFDLTAALNVKSADLSLNIFPGEDDERRANDTLEKFGLNDSTVICALASWSKRAWRRWDAKAWLDVIKQVSRQHNVSWLLFASSRERAELDDIENASDININWAGAQDILHAAALMKRCSAMLCADNGLKHIAVAMGVPTLTVFTGSDFQVWNPPDDPNHPYFDLREVKYNQSLLSKISDTFERIII
ncbi:MAG: glycosyltransferase family 9 protein [Candidatus Hatepunaea meridiana]|nr:glycosyltransferase family 9 protein [Candidatus Hatepunaea meridiana]